MRTQDGVSHWNAESSKELIKCQPPKWCEDCWVRIYSWFREYEEEEMRLQQRMKTMTDMTRKIKAKDRMDAGASGKVQKLPRT